MAEYIEREALLELINEDCKYKNPTNEYTRGCNEVCDWAIKTIKNIPTADVVPKSEVERLKAEVEDKQFRCDSCDRIGLTHSEHIYCIKQARAEVARKIFAEIEFDIHQLMFDRDEHRAIAIEGIIAELKKKYTEGNNEES